MAPRHVLRRISLWLRRWWRDSNALDRRLNATKHDPERQMDAEYEKLQDNGRINPF
jgi:hypothetical protein